MKKIILYGCGEVTNWYLDNNNLNRDEIIGFIETRKSQSEWKSLPVYSLDEIVNIDYDEVWLTNTYYDTLVNCLNVGVPKEKLVICTIGIYQEYIATHKEELKVNYRMARLCDEYMHSRQAQLLTITPNRAQNVYYTDVISFAGNTILQNTDYFRYATFQLIAEEIKNNNIRGDVAELGVFRGKFSKCINTEFNDRKLFLFDTFDGFSSDDIKMDIERGFTSEEIFGTSIFAETSVDYVMDLMPYPESCVVCKGYFPQTIPKDNIKFAFVSIDCDLYSPVLEGLRYFYPKLERGGYIMLHDYNRDSHFMGVKQAVREFENEIGCLVKVPLGDVCGTLVIAK